MLLKTPKRTENTRYSELNTFAQCRMKWFFSYHLGLTKIYDAAPLRRGSIGHAGLAALDSGQDWRKAVDVYTKEYLDSTPQIVSDEFNLDEDFRKDTIAQSEEVKEQIEYYEEYYPRWDKVLHVETQFTVKVPRAKLLVNGTWDGLVEMNGGVYVLERKWVGQFRTEEMFDLDAQLAIYQLAASAFGYKISGIIVDQIGPNPKKPLLNAPDKKTGERSMSKAKKGDWRTYSRALVAAGLDPKNYLDMKESLPSCKPFRRNVVYKPGREIDNYVLDLSSKIADLASTSKRIYTVDDRMRCQMCSFRELCIERLKGGDVDHIVSTQFKTKNNPYDEHEEREEEIPEDLN